MSQKESELEKEQRAERITATIALLQAQKSGIEASGWRGDNRQNLDRTRATTGDRNAVKISDKLTKNSTKK